MHTRPSEKMQRHARNASFHKNCVKVLPCLKQKVHVLGLSLVLGNAQTSEGECGRAWQSQKKGARKEDTSKSNNFFLKPPWNHNFFLKPPWNRGQCELAKQRKKWRKKNCQLFCVCQGVDPSALAFSLASHRHSNISLLFSSRFIDS